MHAGDASPEPEPSAETTPPPHDASSDSPIGIPLLIGHYHIRRLIGHGGMGSVYEAVQEQPRRTVALKVLRTGAATRSAHRRFLYESQLLGRLRHPGIAQVYEAGTHVDNGVRVPYFAMEYIAGARHLTEYAEQKDLSTDDRVRLFIRVCEAVHHGHQKGIVHRDLKPQNILVDSEGRPKVIDFGVARATDSDMAVTTQQTDVGALVGTLQYMSPEQGAADPHDLDTRSDVYSLGVILYELVCRRLPYDLTGLAVPEAVRLVREQAPAKPSSVSAFVRRDLEVILLKALEKDRDRRYRSAADLADDLSRYVAQQPVSARRASMLYQSAMFARRHRTAVTAAAVVFASLVASTTISLRMALRARADNEKLMRFSEFTSVVLGERSGIAKAQSPRGLSLDEAASLAHVTFGDAPAAEAKVRLTLSLAYADRQDWRHAAEQAEEAMRLHSLASPPNAKSDPTLWSFALAAARADTEGGEPEKAVKVLTPFLTDWKSVANDQIKGLLPLMDACLLAHHRVQDWNAMLPLLRDRAQATELAFPGETARLITPRENLSLIEARLGKARDAEQDHDLASQWRRNAELSGVDPRSLPRDPVTDALWPGGARVGAPSPAVLAALGVEVPENIDAPAYVFELAARTLREFEQGPALAELRASASESAPMVMRRRLLEAWEAYGAFAAGQQQQPTTSGLRQYLFTNSQWSTLKSACDQLGGVLNTLEGLPLARGSRWAAQRALLERLCPEDPGRGSPLFDADAFDLCIRGGASPAIMHRTAWKALGRADAPADQYAAALDLARAASRAEPRRADYLAAVGVAQVRTGSFRDAAQTLETTLAMLRTDESQRARCGEAIPVILLAHALLAVDQTRTLGFIQLGQARLLVRDVSRLTLPEETLLACDVPAGISAAEWDRSATVLFLKQLNEFASRAGARP